mgnify:CR=1 FL=1
MRIRFKFLKEKTLGLLIPFLVLLLVILVPRLYFAQEYEPFSRPDGQNIEWDYSKFFIGTLPSLIMKMSWLWFLLALYLDCLIVYPAVQWTQRRYAKKPLDGVDAKLVIAQISIFAGYSYVNLSLLGQETTKKWQYLIPDLQLLLFSNASI